MVIFRTLPMLLLSCMTLLFLNGCSSNCETKCPITAIGSIFSNDEYVSLFNGKDLTGWEDKTGLWRVEDGALTAGDSDTSIEEYPVMYSTGVYKNYELHLEAKMTGELNRNSGIWHRARPFAYVEEEEDEDEDEDEDEEFEDNGEEEPELEQSEDLDDEQADDNDDEDEKDAERPVIVAVTGYEFDIYSIDSEEEIKDEGLSEMTHFWGTLHDSYRRDLHELKTENLDEVKKAFHYNDWNKVVIRCEGNRVQHWINGVLMVDFTDSDELAPLAGKIALQVFQGADMKIQFKNIKIKEL